MKGIAHFAAGVAAASCFPAAVRAGADGNALYFVLGAVAGLLPDTLDFKFYKFIYRHDLEVIPDPIRPDAKLVADAVAYAVERAGRTGRPVRIKLNTVRLGPDEWRRYEVRFDADARRVRVRFGPRVNTSREEVGAADPAADPAEAEAPLGCAIAVEYQAVTIIDIFDGPTFRMARDADGRVQVGFIPWHREWTHGILTAAAAGLAAWALWDRLAGAVVAAAMAAHVLLDQLGFMGSNLWFPFSRQRTPGAQRVQSSDAGANMTAVWGAMLVIFWNLMRAAPRPPEGITFGRLALFGMVAPAAAILLARRWLKPAARNDAGAAGTGNPG